MKFPFLPFIVLTSFLGTAFTCQAQVNSSDSLALVDLYNNTTGTGWTNQTNWVTTSPVSTWYGVSQVGDRVTNVTLGNNNLVGIIPFSVGNLANLQGLNLTQNQLNGGLPSSLGNLANLKSLNLSQNKLSGAIPSSIGSLASLQSLNLSQNLLTGAIPPSISNLVNLQNILLSQNQLSGNIPPGLGNLSDLISIELDSNQLSGAIPVTLSNLPNLRRLLLASNQLSGAVSILPASLGNLHPSYLSLQNNKFTFNGLENLPASDAVTYAPQANITFSKDATTLFVNAGGTLANDTFRLYENGNLIATKIADSSFALTQTGNYYITVTNSIATGLTLTSGTLNLMGAELDSLSLVTFFKNSNGPSWKYKNNWLSATPLQYWQGVSVSNGRVTGLALAQNNLTASIPLVLANLAKLQRLDLDSNNLTGGIPETLGNLVNLTFLHLKNNSLNGSIPASFVALVNLLQVDLSQNNLSGQIPDSVGNLLNLQTLNLSHNQISGNIPPSICNLVHLQGTSSYYSENKTLTNLGLDLSYNNLTGSLPSSLGNLIRLFGINLSHNQLTGSLPSSLGNIYNLVYLDLANNQFNGDLPPALGYLTSLQYISLSHNQLTGKIPFWGSSYLYVVRLDNNKLTGSVPRMIVTDTIDASYNQLSGGLTKLLENYGGAQVINLSHNWLNDTLLANLGDFTIEHNIDLSYNQLKGNIPPWLNKYSSISFLNLSHNQFSGSIPSTYSNAANISYLDLSFNQLSGAVPAIIAQSLHLEYNKFTFNGIEVLPALNVADSLHYAPQAHIPMLQNGLELSVSAGGTPANDTFRLYKNGSLINTQIGDSIFTTDGTNSRYLITVTNKLATHLTLYSDTLSVNSSTAIVPAKPATKYASYEYTDSTGWTHYYYNNNTPNDVTDDTLLLSLKKNGQDIGSIGDGTFAVKLVATAAAGSNAAVKLTNPLITNPTGYWVMNRYWQVTPTHEPANSVGVRFYYNNQDLADVNGSYPTHNLTNDKLIFYKTVGGNPDPTSNLAGATKIISILPGTVAGDTSWTYHALNDTTQYGEYSVASFSGGGGGGTGNNAALPVVLANFTASLAKNDVQLHWQTAQEVNAGYYTVERSVTGRDYTAVGRINAAGNTSIPQGYKLNDYNAALLNTATLYYRLKIADKNGNVTFSKVISLNLAGDKGVMLVYPNPAKNTATVTFTTPTLSKYTLTVTNLAGKTIQRVQGVATVGLNHANVNLQGLAQGSYLVTITGDMMKSETTVLLKQ